MHGLIPWISGMVRNDTGSVDKELRTLIFLSGKSSEQSYKGLWVGVSVLQTLCDGEIEYLSP